MGIALLAAETERTLWVNTALRLLLESGAKAGNVSGLSPAAYLPGLNAVEWEEAVQAQRDAMHPEMPSAPHRLQFVHNTDRAITYWEWTLQLVGAETPRYLLLTVASVTDVVMGERLLATASQRADRARDRAEAMVRLTQLVNASLTTPDLLRAITREAAAYFGSRHAAVLLLLPDGQRFEIGYSIGLQSLGSDASPALERTGTLAGRALDAQETLLMTEPLAQGIATPRLDDETLPAMLISSPIQHNNHIYGVVEVYFEEPRSINEEARSLLTAFAEQTAFALLKTDLYEQIEAQRRQLQTIFDNAPVGILYFDMEQRALSANATAVQQFAASADAIIGHHYSEFLHNMPPVLFDKAREGQPFHFSHYTYHDPQNQEIVADVSLIPLRTSDQRMGGLLMLTFDVTDLVTAQEEAEAARKAAEDALNEVRATQMQMVQMEKMRAIGELASGVAHDFNNALMAILGYTELAEDNLDNPDALAGHLRIITKAARDAASTVRRLQDFARLRKVTHGERIDLNAVVQDVLDLTRPRWRDDAQKEGRVYHVTTDLRPLPPVFAEASGLREVLINLIHNALHAMPDGGSLALATRRADDGCLEIALTDTGHGMTPDVLARVFEPFYTTRASEGSGLGLAVSWTIVQRHGGTLLVNSEPGKGTTFTIRLPAATDEPTPPLPVRDPAPPSGPGVHILVVDDEPLIASVLASILRKRGHRVTLAYNAREALEHLRLADEPYRLLLTDHGMPGMTGLQLIAEVRRIQPDLPIALLTGWGDSVLHNHLPDALPDAILGKPINQSDLLDNVARLLNKETPA